MRRALISSRTRQPGARALRPGEFAPRETHVQWSTITDGELDARQNRYRESGVKCIWLKRVAPRKRAFRNVGTDAERPAFAVQQEGATYFLPQFPGLGVSGFVTASLSGEIRLWPRVGSRTLVQVMRAEVACPSCGCFTRYLSAVRYIDAAAADGVRPAVDLTPDEGDIFFRVASALVDGDPKRYGMGPVRSASMKVFPYSNIARQRRVQLTSACEHCHAPLVTERMWTGSNLEQMVARELRGVVPKEAARVARWFFRGVPIETQLAPRDPAAWQRGGARAGVLGRQSE